MKPFLKPPLESWGLILKIALCKGRFFGNFCIVLQESDFESQFLGHARTVSFVIEYPTYHRDFNQWTFLTSFSSFKLVPNQYFRRFRNVSARVMNLFSTQPLNFSNFDLSSQINFTFSFFFILRIAVAT